MAVQSILSSAVIVVTCLLNLNEAQNRDYILATWKERTMDWNAAEQYCQDTYESHLATMLTQQDYDHSYNYSYFGGFNGLNDRDENGQYQWIDGTPCDHPDNSPLCSEYFEANDDIPGYCSLIPWGGHKSTESLCTTDYNQFFCNKVRSYVYVKEAKSYKDAEKYCQETYQTHLATITSKQDINNALSKILKSNKNVWVGLYNYQNDNIWLDGTEVVVDDVIDFVELQPDGSNCRSFEYNDSYIRDNDGCNELLPFVCNKRARPREYILGEETDKTFVEAQEICRTKYGTGLATVITEEEFSDAMYLLPYFEVGWIGLAKDDRDQQYKWLDGSECSVDNTECVPYWNEHDPNEPNYDCVMLWQNGRAKSRECEKSALYYLCNKPMKSIEIVSQEPDVKTEI